MSSILARCTEAFADFVFPRICCGCERRIVEPHKVVCGECDEGLEKLLHPICDTCGCPNAVIKGSGRCADCPPQVEFEKARGATTFSGTGKTVVEKLKYHARLEYAPFMARHMYNCMLAGLGNVPFDSIVAVPLHSARLRERGFNQSREIAQFLSRYSGAPVVDALSRTRPTPTQTRLNRDERAKNMAGAFAVRRKNVQGQTVLLVDDVFTTGATLNECARVLREEGAETVYCVAFARASVSPR